MDSGVSFYLDCKELVMNVSTKANQKFLLGEHGLGTREVLSSLNYPVLVQQG